MAAVRSGHVQRRLERHPACGRATLAINAGNYERKPMTKAERPTEPSPPAQTPGVKRAGPGEYHFDIANVNSVMGGPDYSTAFGGCVEGERMMAALMRMPAGTGAESHTHPNEQWIYILEGAMESVVNGQREIMTPGHVIYIPAGTIHYGRALPEADVVFFTVKDTSHGLHGIKTSTDKT
jgi:quercetin dioxygenase-like cupin family protein